MAKEDILKEQFLLVFSNDGHYQWSNEYKKQYVFALKQSLDNEPKDLPENIISKSSEDIYNIVVKYDIELKLFSLFNRNYELYSKKNYRVVFCRLF